MTKNALFRLLIMDTKDRIKLIMESQHMTQQGFADFLQQAPATLSSIFNGRTRPTLNIVDAIKAKIPDISIEWLLYGTGEMYMPHPETVDQDHTGNNGSPRDLLLNFDAPDAVPAQTGGSNYGGLTPQSSISRTGNVMSAEIKPRHTDYFAGEVKNVEKNLRKVTEIRVYYDDQTYETFVPAKK